MQKSDVLLEIRNIQASYKEYPALNNVSLDIKKKYSTWSGWRIRFRKVNTGKGYHWAFAG